MRELNTHEVQTVNGAGLLAGLLTAVGGAGGRLLDLNVQAGNLLGVDTGAGTTLYGDILTDVGVGLLGIVNLGTDLGVNA